jgi:hypothetical protein
LARRVSVAVSFRISRFSYISLFISRSGECRRVAWQRAQAGDAVRGVVAGRGHGAGGAAGGAGRGGQPAGRERKRSETKSGASEGRELAGWEGAKLSEGELWLSAAWADGSSDWQRAADVRGSEYAPQLLEYYEGLFEELTN